MSVFSWLGHCFYRTRMHMTNRYLRAREGMIFIFHTHTLIMTTKSKRSSSIYDIDIKEYVKTSGKEIKYLDTFFLFPCLLTAVKGTAIHIVLSLSPRFPLFLLSSFQSLKFKAVSQNRKVPKTLSMQKQVEIWALTCTKTISIVPSFSTHSHYYGRFREKNSYQIISRIFTLSTCCVFYD